MSLKPDQDDSRFDQEPAGPVSRRDFLRLSALAGAGLGLTHVGESAPADAAFHDRGDDDVKETTIAELQAAMESRRLTSQEIVQAYLDRIQRVDRRGAQLNSVIEVNPQARDIARAL